MRVIRALRRDPALHVAAGRPKGRPTASLKSFRTGIICLFHVVPGNPVVPGIPGCSRILELESSKIRYTPSAYNYSDTLTKPLTEVMFQRMIEMCLGSKGSQIAESGHQVEGFLCTGYDSYLVYIY